MAYVESLFGLGRDSAAVALLAPRLAGAATGANTEANALLALAHARAGHSQQARDILLAMRDATLGPLPPRATLAAALAALGDIDSAIAVLTAAVNQRDPALLFFSRAPRFDPLRKDPRAVTLLGQLER
jgi:hypothetical protein